MLADLHSHTFYSDGILAPETLVQRAANNHVTHLAITDHDTTDALAIAQAAARALNINLVKGVEISCLWQGREIHVVGLLINPQSPPLQELLTRQQSKRWQRAEAIDKKMQNTNLGGRLEDGSEGLTEHLKGLGCRSVGRAHIARYLIQQGLAKDMNQAFKRFLAKNKKLWVAAQWCSLEQALSAIHGAQGLAVLAHPSRYKLNRRQLVNLLDSFSGHGGDAMEVSYSNLPTTEMINLSELCRSQQLWASAGSDFHDPAKSWTDLGKFSPLSEAMTTDLKAIWQHPAWPKSF